MLDVCDSFSPELQPVIDLLYKITTKAKLKNVVLELLLNSDKKVE